MDVCLKRVWRICTEEEQGWVSTLMLVSELAKNFDHRVTGRVTRSRWVSEKLAVANRLAAASGLAVASRLAVAHTHTQH